MSIALDNPVRSSRLPFETAARHVDEVRVDYSQTSDPTSIMPILSRLPQSLHTSSPTELEHDDQSSLTDYLTLPAHPNLPGTLESSPQPVLYTASTLPFIDDASLDLWKALHNLRLLSTSYTHPSFPLHSTTTTSNLTSHCPLSTSSTTKSQSHLHLLHDLFNFSSLTLTPNTSGIFYGVLFLSVRLSKSSSTDLYLADKLAHEEAVRSGGLLMYLYGAPDPVTGANVATCVWSSREDARRASGLQRHREAVGRAREAYGAFELGRYAVVKRAGEVGVRVEEWREDGMSGGD